MSESQHSEYLNKLSNIHTKLNAYIKHIGNKVERLTIQPNDQ